MKTLGSARGNLVEAFNGMHQIAATKTPIRDFWRPPGGESCADVYDRISLFIDSLWRVFQCQNDVENGVVLIVSHGLALRHAMVALVTRNIHAYQKFAKLWVYRFGQAETERSWK